MRFTEIQISGLREGKHSFQFGLDSRFSAAFSEEFFTEPRLEATITLEVSETMIQAQIEIRGTVVLVCDRSLELFSYPVNTRVNHFFKFGEEEKELSDELEVISQERVHLDFDQLVYDTVALSLPGKKLHPDFASETSESEDEEGQLVYSTRSDAENELNERDNRWDILKILN